jgi:hypothetical protein
VADGDGQATTEGQAPEGGDGTQNEQGGQRSTEQQPSTEGQAPKDGGKTDLKTLPQDVQDYISSLREEAASKRVDVKSIKEDVKKEVAREFGVALGLVEDPNAKPDADALAAQAAQKAQEATAAQRELAVFKAAPEGVKVQDLLDSRSFLDTISNIDPTDQAGLKKAIDDAVAARPSLKIAAGPARSGGDLGGGQEKPGDKAPMGLEGALSKHYAKPQA